MKSRATTIIVALVLAICLVCPLVEMFDHWDHTVQTGNDTEYTFVILALCVGALYTLARTALRMSRSSQSKRTDIPGGFLASFSWGSVNLIVEALISASPPLTALRI
jgi:hypothetical protein